MCEKCDGVGYQRYDKDPALRLHCDCPMGRDLKRVDVKAAKTAAAVRRDWASLEIARKLAPDYKLRAARDSE